MFGWLGWLAPAPWVWLILRREVFTRRQYTLVWLAGFLYWMLTLHWVCYPHPLTPIGWPFLCAYLAIYLMLFVLTSRAAVHVLHTPAWVAAPIVWVGLELVQAHLFTGFQVGALSHTQAGFPLLIQFSDLTGGYGVSFLLVLTASAAVSLFQTDLAGFTKVAGAVVTILLVAATLLYGWRRFEEVANPRPGPVVALIQGDTRATWDPDPSRNQQIMDAQLALTQQAAELAEREGATIDLFVWPESMFRAPLVTMGNQPTLSRNLPEIYKRAGSASEEFFAGLAQEHNAAFLVGIDRFNLAKSATSESGYDEANYNSAALATRQGRVTQFYDKTHRVPFGEYIPFAKNMPALYYLTPMSGGLGQGKGPVSMRLDTHVGQVRFAPSICYESVIPHVIRRHVAQLTAAGEPPDVLVNVTNDAWFWGSAELDLHLACGVFRAVENRLPMVIAANTGLSAVIDGSGRVLRVTERMQPDVIVAEAPLDGRASFYSAHGDWFALACLLVTVVLATTSVWKARTTRTA